MKDILKGQDFPEMPYFLVAKRINEEGLELIKEFEGLSLKAYRCPGGVWTIGYGHTGGVRPHMVIGKDDAEAYLKEDLRSVERALDKLIKVKVNSNQFSALVSFAFNVGLYNFENSTLLKLLNRGWYDQVPAQLMRWNKSRGQVLGGLSRRRAAEGQLWKKDVEA